SLPDLAGASGRYGFFASHAAGVRVGGLARPGTAPFITGLGRDGGGAATLAWRHGRPPYVIEASTNVAGAWFDLTPATMNPSRALPPLTPPVFLRVRGTEPEP
ncbi:MAG TPA: hypothetical protein PKE47_17720, partial [Verrucomicrobiota bacterium]|nr:hypothetical protein [Verrucomicrobiota bacterium]